MHVEFLKKYKKSENSISYYKILEYFNDLLFINDIDYEDFEEIWNNFFNFLSKEE